MDGNYSLSDIAAVSGGRNDGMFGGDWSAWIILFLLFGLFGNGNGFGFGGGFGGRGCGQPATTADLTSQSIISKLDGLTNGLSDSTYALNNAITSGFSGVQSQLASCCCGIERAIDGVNYNTAKGFCDLNNAMNINTRDILESNNANTRAILDFLTNSRMEDLRAENTTLKSQIGISNQNAVLQAYMDANKAEILRRTGAECPTAAYIVQPPQPVTFPTNCCGQFSGYNNGCGCGNF